MVATIADLWPSIAVHKSHPLGPWHFSTHDLLFFFSTQLGIHCHDSAPQKGLNIGPADVQKKKHTIGCSLFWWI